MMIDGIVIIHSGILQLIFPRHTGKREMIPKRNTKPHTVFYLVGYWIRLGSEKARRKETWNLGKIYLNFKDEIAIILSHVEAGVQRDTLLEIEM